MIINGRYFIDDAETGLYEVNKKEYERYTALMQVFWEHLKIKLDPNLIKGKIIVFGTGGSLDDNDNYADLFYKPENYNLIL